jgi:hypothetical protein
MFVRWTALTAGNEAAEPVDALVGCFPKVALAVETNTPITQMGFRKESRVAY